MKDYNQSTKIIMIALIIQQFSEYILHARFLIYSLILVMTLRDRKHYPLFTCETKALRLF